MKWLYAFEERAPIFIELAWGISLSSASRLLAATILAGALAGSAMAQAPDAGCALPSEPQGIPDAIDAAITGPMSKDRACMKGPVNTRSAHDVRFTRHGRSDNL
jgi:hypothetical protein